MSGSRPDLADRPADRDGGGDDGSLRPRAVIRTRRRPALDGLRALAVSAVVLYHVDPDLLPGGFVGVDLFFVLSGYLITTLLLREHDGQGAVSLRNFWTRRMRRLWPLGWSVIAAVAVAGLFGVWDADQQHTLPSQTLAGLANVANWWQLAHGGYLESFSSPSPLRHLWSLSVEEQLYVVWPLVLVGLLWLAARRGRLVVWAGIASLAVYSVVDAWVSTPDRAYLATGSRAIGVLVGAALAFAWSRTPLSAPSGTRAGVLIGVWGAVGAAFLVWACWTADPSVPWLHRGGFLAIALAGAGVIAVALRAVHVRGALSARPLVWLGERSYAVYLLHWPILVAVTFEQPLWVRLTIVVLGSLVLAEVLHRVLERPVIERRVQLRVLGLAAIPLLLLTGLSLHFGATDAPTTEQRLGRSLDRVADPGSSPSGSGAASTTTTTCVPSAAAAPAFGSGSEFDALTVQGVADPTATPCADQVRVLVFGDSTGRGVSNGLNALQDPRLQVWDRTELGCSFGPERCGDWRTDWPISVIGVHPDVVLIYTTVVLDLKGVDDAPFMSAEAHRQRVETFEEAAKIGSSTGARVIFVSPAVPSGTFYCVAQNRRTTCDPDQVEEWRNSLREAAAASGAQVLDVAGWVAANTTKSDRPDGLHLSGDALRRHAEWLLPQLLAAGDAAKASGG